MITAAETIKGLKAQLDNMPASSRVEHLVDLIKKLNDGDFRNQILQFAELYISGIYNSEKPKVVVLVHGIRTQAKWFDTLERRIGSLDNTSVARCKYGFFNAIRFALFDSHRKLVIESVRANINSAYNDPKNKDKDFYLIAHSFGTYISTEILKNDPHIKFKKIIFCGSVVDENFRWDTLKNSPSYPVINECGTKDQYPLLAKASTFIYGNSGCFGFNYQPCKNRFHDSGHSDFFTDAFYEKYWIPFIVQGEFVDSEHTFNRPDPSWTHQIMSEKKGIFYIIVIAITLLVIFTIYVKS